MARIRTIRDSQYSVTSAGDVISPRGAVLRPWQSGRYGHLKVQIEDGRRRFVHQLVAESFLGERPDGADVRHLNGNPADNRVENLTYGTRSENVLDSVRHGTYRNANGEKSSCPKGHDYDTQNTYTDTSGRRRCRKCRDRWR